MLILQEAKEYLRAFNDITDVRNDPGYQQANELAVSLISSQGEAHQYNEKDLNFVIDSLSGQRETDSLKNEMEVLNELFASELDKTASAWVTDWNDKKINGDPDPEATLERRDFITMSLDNKVKEKDDQPKRSWKVRSLKSPLIRYLALAAVFAGAFLVIRSLLPLDSQELFNKYYQPYTAVSSISRSQNATVDNNFNLAVGNYRSGNYEMAAQLFSRTTLNSSHSGQSKFYLGLTEIGLKDPAKAVSILKEVAGTQGEYSGDARWYLGLAYLLEGNKEKAAESFKMLYQSGGFYSKPSKKILRRLR
ncbi:MAG: tetratricopeptide repeat protein [Bacteroidales bacterium]